MTLAVAKAKAASTAPGTATWTPTTPTPVAVGDLIVIQATTDSSTHTITGVSAGYTIRYSQALGTGTGSMHLVTGTYQGSDPVLTLNVAWGANHVVLNHAVYDKTLYPSFGTLGTIYTRPGLQATTNAPAAGTTAQAPIVLFHEKTTNQTSCTVPGVTTILNTFPSVGAAGSAYMGSFDPSAGTSSQTATYLLAGNLNGAGVQLPLNLPPVSTPVTQFIAATPMYVAHRGGSADWVEETMFAYGQAVAWNRTGLALEISVWQTSDGVWVASHDQTTGRMFGTNLDIPTNSWATLSALRTTTGGYPLARLTDILTAYANGTRVFFVDNKGQQNPTAFLNLLDTYGGSSNFISKGFCTSTTMADAATARGYQTWGYYFSTDVPVNLPATQSHWSLLGMDSLTASGSDWTAVKAFGKPVLAHIIATTGQKTTATGFGANGFVASGVVEVVPQVGTQRDLNIITIPLPQRWLTIPLAQRWTTIPEAS